MQAETSRGINNAAGLTPANPTREAQKAPIIVRRLRLDEVGQASALTRAHPELGAIAADEIVRGVLEHNASSFWGVYPDASGPNQPVLGFYGFLFLNATGERALVEGTLDPRNPDLACLAPTEERPVALYVWLVVMPGLVSRAVPMINAELGKDLKGIPIYARAGTQAGLAIMRREGYVPLDPQKDGIGGLFRYDPVEARRLNAFHIRAIRPRFEVKVASTGEEVEQALAVRAAVYLIEQNCPYDEEFDGNDRTGTHIVGYVNGEPAATMRLRYFADFVKLERMSVLPRFRNTLIAKELVRYVVEFVRRKGYRKVYGHAQQRLLSYWQRFGFKPLESNYSLTFSDHEYVLMHGELEPHPNALTMHSDPYVLLRPEGKWDEPCALERSASRPATNPH